MGLAEQLVAGIAQFAGLYTTTESGMMVTNENTNASLGGTPPSTTSGSIRLLKHHDLHCLGFDKRILEPVESLCPYCLLQD
jgi:hypothetical protein